MMFFLLLLFPLSLFAEISLGVDRLFTPTYATILKNKKIGLITNQTGISSKLETTIDLFVKNQAPFNYELKALFGPEHGIYGDVHAAKWVGSKESKKEIPIYSLHGETRRPTEAHLAGITLLVYDIQDIGTRSYTYISTLFYVMEEAAKRKIPVVVLDRPNPINGTTIDGPMLEESFRSFIGYINIPYVHGMTIGELARFFNQEYSIKCELAVIPMAGWKRAMNFEETKLYWIPTSPNVPTSQSALCYPASGLIGELGLASIGIGYTLPFQIVAAPWIQSNKLSQLLNSYKLPGIHFHPIRVRPFSGKHAQEECQGVQFIITNKNIFLPVTTQYAVLAALKELYPAKVLEKLEAIEKEPKTFFKACGTKALHTLLLKEKKPFEPLKKIHEKDRLQFIEKRKRYLFVQYN